jgi:hypothetical protein
VALLERAFTLTIEAEPLRQKLRRDGIRDWREAEKSGALSADEAAQLEAHEAADAKVIAVDDFAADAFARTTGPKANAEPPSSEPARPKPARAKRSKPADGEARTAKPRAP